MYTDIVILSMLVQGPMHGYEIKKRTGQVLGGFVSLNNKVLYTTLKRFEDMSAVEREVVRQEGKPDRHIYYLTEQGRELLQMLLQDTSPDILQNHVEFIVRIALFEQIEPEARRDILRIRQDFVTKRTSHMREMRELAQSMNADSFMNEVIAFEEQQSLYELEWIQSLMRRFSPV